MYQTCSSLFYFYCLDHSTLIQIYNLMLLMSSLLMQLCAWYFDSFSFVSDCEYFSAVLADFYIQAYIFLCS